MAISILHRITGSGLATVGAAVLIWWLAAAASGAEAYARFTTCITSPLGVVVLIGLTWAFFQHLFSGLRHFVLDMGAGYELQTNKTWSILIPIAAVVVTVLIWASIYVGVL